MINKTIYILLITTSLFAQIQKSGLPEFYNERSISIDYMLVDSKEVIDRGFHPMVFQFGYEYELDLDILAKSLVIENNGNAGISIITGTSNQGSIYFGDDGNNAGRIIYDHSVNKLYNNAEIIMVCKL